MRKLLFLALATIFLPTSTWSVGADSSRTSLHVVKRGDSTIARSTAKFVPEDSVTDGDWNHPYQSQTNDTLLTKRYAKVSRGKIDSLSTDSLGVYGRASFRGRITAKDSVDVNGLFRFAPDSTKLSFPDTTFSATTTAGGSAYRIIVGSLLDPATCWDYARFRELEKLTSWYPASGPFPTEYAMWITGGQDSVIVADRQRGSIWMVFNLWVYTATDIKFVDGQMYYTHSGDTLPLVRVDFLKDQGMFWYTNGPFFLKDNIKNREAGSGTLNYNSSPAIVNAAVNAVSAIRDPLGGIDEKGRPKARVRVETAGGVSTSDAGIANIYDSSITGSWLWGYAFPDGHGFEINSDATRDNVHWKYSVQTTAADGFTYDDVFTNNGSGSEAIPWDNATVFSQVAAIPNASVSATNSPIVVFGSDSGLVVSHAKRNDNTNGLTWTIDATRNSPPWSSTADSLGWAFESAADTLNVWSKCLTRAGTGSGVSYGAGVIGQCAILDGSANGQYFYRYGDRSLRTGAGAVSYMLWVKFASLATEGPLMIRETPANQKRIYFYPSGGVIHFERLADADVDITGPAISVDTWYQLVGIYDGTNWMAYVNGEKVGTAASAGVILSDSLWVGGASNSSPSGVTKSIDGFNIIPRALSASEIRWLYQQGLHGIQSNIDPNDALDTTYVAGVAVDPRSHFTATWGSGNGTRDSVTVWDEYFIPKYRIGSPGGNIKSVAIWSSPGADSISVAIGTTTKLRWIQTDPRIADLAGGYQRPTYPVHEGWAFHVTTPADSGTWVEGSVTISAADSLARFDHVGPTKGNLRVGGAIEAGGSIYTPIVLQVGADLAEMFAVPANTQRTVVKAFPADTKDIRVPPFARASTIQVQDNDSTRSYSFEMHQIDNVHPTRLLLDASVKGRSPKHASSTVYTQGVEVGDTLRYAVDTTTVVKIRVTQVRGDTVTLASQVPAETKFRIIPPGIILRFAGTRIGPGDVVQMGSGKVMRLSLNVGARGWVVSTNPTSVMNFEQEGVAVALAGTTPCVVSADSGAVAVGDPLTAGAQGVAVRAWWGNDIIGWAQEAVATGVKRISVLVE